MAAIREVGHYRGPSFEDINRSMRNAQHLLERQINVIELDPRDPFQALGGDVAARKFPELLNPPAWAIAYHAIVILYTFPLHIPNERIQEGNALREFQTQVTQNVITRIHAIAIELMAEHQNGVNRV